MNNKDKTKYFWSQRENSYRLIGEYRIASIRISSGCIGRVHLDEVLDEYVFTPRLFVTRYTPETIEIIQEKLEELNK